MSFFVSLWAWIMMCVKITSSLLCLLSFIYTFNESEGQTLLVRIITSILAMLSLAIICNTSLGTSDLTLSYCFFC